MILQKGMVMIEDSNALFNEICRLNGWKRTVQRREVFTYLNGNLEHPSVETVWKHVRERLPDVSLDSIYRILNDFAEAGIIKCLKDAKVMRYDPNTQPHDHFFCSECGRIYDFSYLHPDKVISICEEFGRVTSVDLHVRGVCRDCNAKLHPQCAVG